MHKAQLTLEAADARPARARGRRHSRWRLVVPGAPNTVFSMLGLAGHLDRKFILCMPLLVCFDCIATKATPLFSSVWNVQLCARVISAVTLREVQYRQNWELLLRAALATTAAGR